MFDQGGSCGRIGLVRILRPIRRPHPTPVQLDILPTESVSVYIHAHAHAHAQTNLLLHQSGDHRNELSACWPHPHLLHL
ncbi:rCG50656 [Rattus norvegicus]|uniref:RCG50656 n=1 Tax=Rattus norvegicus TaxID=10116 RepID=A6KCX0_RAT|nr:rCG50656 [Rattus norvegicus]